MSQGNYIVDAIGYIMTNYPTFGIIVLCAMFLVCFTLLGVYLFAFYQGREVQLCGMRIGPATGTAAHSKHAHELINLIDAIGGRFSYHQKDIDWFLEHVRHAAEGGLHAMLSFVEDCRNEFRTGRIGEARLDHPFDFTLSVIRCDGVCIDHDYHPLVERMVINDYPFNKMLKERKGSFYWQTSNFKSYAMKKLIGQCSTERISKVDFIYLSRLNVIVSFELHINIIFQLPMEISAEMQSNNEQRQAGA